MKTKMPRFIRLAGRRIRISTEYSQLNRSTQGICKLWENWIVLDSSMAPDQLKATAVHEIVHDLEQLVGIGMNEQAVTSFSSVLFAALRDNPKLVEWLMDKA